MTHLLSVNKEYHKFSSAHFTLFPDGSRERLHGHNYSLQMELAAPRLVNGFVVDFGPLKKVARRICDALDEKVLLPESPRVIIKEMSGHLQATVDGEVEYQFPLNDVVRLPVTNITSECLAEVILKDLLAERASWDPTSLVTLLRVWIQETSGQRGGVETILSESSGV